MKPLGKMMPLLIEDKVIAQTVLNRLVYFADAIHYLEQGTTISGEDYYKSTRGPVPHTLTDVRQQLVASGVLREAMISDGLLHQFTYSVTHPGNVMQYRDSLPSTAISVINRVRERLGDQTTSCLSEGALKFEPWKSHLIGDRLDLARIRWDAAWSEWLRTHGV